MIDLINFVAGCIIATLLFTTVGGDIGMFLEDLKDFSKQTPLYSTKFNLLSVPFVFHLDLQNQTVKMQKFLKARCNVGSSADKQDPG